MTKDGLKIYEFTQPDQLAQMATILKDHIVKNKLYTTIVGKNYVHVEGWQFAGGLVGLFPKVTRTEDISRGKGFKWFAEVEITNLKSDQVVSRGVAICSNAEGKKRSFDEYAVLSMAQTRAIGKAYRNLLGWVMKLAGYEATPAEEMTKVGEEPKIVNEMSPIEAECQECGNPMTNAEKDYSVKRFKKQLCRQCQTSSKK